jgi:HEAT repeat protein
MALGGIVWLLTRPGEDAGGTGPTGSGRPTASVERDVILVSVPASYSDASVERLARQLRSSDLRSRVEAANALAALGPRAGEAVPALLNAMGRAASEIEFARAVGKAMKAIGPAAVPRLVSALRSDVPKARFHAAGALAKLGPDAAGAVAALTEALEADPDYSVRSNAAVALGAIGPAASSALPALRRAAGGPNEKLTGDPARAELRVRARMAMDQVKGK